MNSDDLFNIPILMLIFNRPAETKLVFEKIRAIKPKFLYVAADGPRYNNEQDLLKCNLTRDIIKKIDWECKLKTLFHEKNLGCGLAPSLAIDWFFNEVDEGIILEDDCVPRHNFFHYCQALLNYYRKESSIMHIGGLNILPKNLTINESIYFSAIPLSWGWATWKRAWILYDYKINDLDQSLRNHFLDFYFKDPVIKKYWENIFKELIIEQNHIWDYQWLYCIWKNKGLSVSPKINLIDNIGFNDDATHTKKKFIIDVSKNKTMRLPIIFPKMIKINYKADDLYNGQYIYKRPTLLEKFIFSLKRFYIKNLKSKS